MEENKYSAQDLLNKFEPYLGIVSKFIPAIDEWESNMGPLPQYSIY
jgi:hypothetical protein